MELHDGDIIVFNDIINNNIIGTYNLIFKFKNNTTSTSFLNASGFRINESALYYVGITNAMYSFSLNEWNGQAYKTIYINGDQTITDEAFINWLYENTVSGLPPRVMENMYAVVGDQIQYSFSNISDVVGSIVNNGVLTIFTLGIFIVSLAVGLLRRIARRKNFK